MAVISSAKHLSYKKTENAEMRSPYVKKRPKSSIIEKKVVFLQIKINKKQMVK